MTRIYLDACSIIYLVESTNPFHAGLVAKLSQYRSGEMSSVITSRLSLLEFRMRPIKERNTKLLAAYDAFFDADRLVLGEITASVIDRATLLRASHGFASPDAIHLATAVEERVDVFLTGDGALARCNEVKVEVLKAE